jgi:hypothetical protein
MSTYSNRRAPWRTRGAVALIGLALTLVFAAGCTHSAGSRPAVLVRVSTCGGAPQAQPDVVNLNCLNNSIMARHLRWVHWGGPVATAIGSATVDLCAYEDCASGDYVTVPIVLITSKMVRCPSSSHAYSRLQYVFVGGSPFAGLNARLSIPDGSVTPANPHDQTVNLLC